MELGVHFLYFINGLWTPKPQKFPSKSSLQIDSSDQRREDICELKVKVLDRVLFAFHAEVCGVEARAEQCVEREDKA